MKFLVGVGDSGKLQNARAAYSYQIKVSLFFYYSSSLQRDAAQKFFFISLCPVLLGRNALIMYFVAARVLRSCVKIRLHELCFINNGKWDRLLKFTVKSLDRKNARYRAARGRPITNVRRLADARAWDLSRDSPRVL